MSKYALNSNLLHVARRTLSSSVANFHWEPSLEKTKTVWTTHIYSALADSPFERANEDYRGQGDDSEFMMALSPRRENIVRVARNDFWGGPNHVHYVKESIPYIQIAMAMRFPAFLLYALKYRNARNALIYNHIKNSNNNSFLQEFDALVKDNRDFTRTITHLLDNYYGAFPADENDVRRKCFGIVDPKIYNAIKENFGDKISLKPFSEEEIAIVNKLGNQFIDTGKLIFDFDLQARLLDLRNEESLSRSSKM